MPELNEAPKPTRGIHTKIVDAYIAGNTLLPQTGVAISIFMADAMVRNLPEIKLAEVLEAEMNPDQTAKVYSAMNKLHRHHSLPVEHTDSPDFTGKRVTDDEFNGVWGYAKMNSIDELYKLSMTVPGIRNVFADQPNYSLAFIRGDLPVIKQCLQELQEFLINNPELKTQVEALTTEAQKYLAGQEGQQLAQELQGRLDQIYSQLGSKRYSQIQREKDQMIAAFTKKTMGFISNDLKSKFPNNDWRDYEETTMEE